MLLLSASPGPGGAARVLKAAEGTFPHLGGNVIATFSLPNFTQNFSPDKGITDHALASDFEAALATFKDQM